MTPVATQASPRVSFLKGDQDMGRRRGQRSGHLREHHGSWLLTYRVYDTAGKSQRETVTIGPAEGPGKFTEKQAERVAWDHYLSKVDQVAQQPRALTKVCDFWKANYKAHADLNLKKGTREQYTSLYNLWIEPVIGNKRLATLEPSHVRMCLARAKEANMSPSTLKHIRKVISAIYTVAKSDRVASGDNPATIKKGGPTPLVRPHVALSAEQVATLLGLLEEPVRTMVYTAIMTSMNVAELCGLRWKHVNLTTQFARFDGEGLGGYRIAVREHFSRGEFGTLKATKRTRFIELTQETVDQLVAHKDRAKKAGPDDIVFASRAGTPLNGNNIGKRILSPLAETLKVSSLGWHTFRHTHATFTAEVEMNEKDRQETLGHANAEMTALYTDQNSLKLRESKRDKLAKIGGLIAAAQKAQDEDAQLLGMKAEGGIS